MSASFRDHFSEGADAYARARPTYPPALFDWIDAIAPRGTGPRRAWDCGCGSGQASTGLTRHFDEVVATDGSAAQLAHAVRAPRVRYAAGLAERAPIAGASIAAIVVAQALHWMELDRVFAEVRRVGIPGAAIVVWTYGTTVVDPSTDHELEAFNREVLASWWPPEREHVDAGYATLPFPFPRIHSPPFTMRARWTRDAFLAYVGTWSAVSRARRASGVDPMPELARRVTTGWPADEVREVRWPLTVLAGRISNSPALEPLSGA